VGSRPGRLTCQQCFRGRHRACEDKLDCGCDVCKHERARVVVRKYVPGAHSPKEYVPTGRAPGRPSKYTPEQIATALVMHRQGESWVDITNHLGVERTSFVRMVRKHHPEVAKGKGSGRRLSAEEVQLIARMRAGGATWPEIERTVGVSENSGRDALKRAGLA